MMRISFSTRTVRLLSGVGIILLCGIIYLLVQTRANKATMFYSEALATRGIEESVVVRGVEYRVGKDGVYAFPLPLLMLAYEKAAARYSPLFAMPGVDPDEFASAVDNLSLVQQRIAARQDTPLAAARVATRLYPTDFLHALGELESRRLSFLASGTANDAQRYQLQQRIVVSEFKTALRLFQSGFLASVPPDIGAYATDSRIIEREGVLQALETIRDSGERTAQVLRSRSRCFRGQIASCRTQDIALPLIRPLDHKTEQPSSASRRLAREATGILQESGVILDPNGSLIQLARSSCVKSRVNTSALFALDFSRVTPAAGFPSALYAGDILALLTAPHASLPFFKFFAANGAEFVPIRQLAYYHCPEAGRDLAMIFAITNVRTFALEQHLDAIAPEKYRPELERLERALSSDTVSEYDAAAYLAVVSSTDILKRMDASVRDDFISLYLRFAYRSTGTLQVVRDIASIESANLALDPQRIGIDFDELYFFFTRSGFVSLFAADNASAAGNHDDLFAPNTLPDSAQPIVRLSTLPRTWEVRQRIIRDYVLYNQVYRRAAPTGAPQ